MSNGLRSDIAVILAMVLSFLIMAEFKKPGMTHKLIQQVQQTNSR